MNRNIADASVPIHQLRIKYSEQFFIFHDYQNDQKQTSSSFDLDFQQWLQATEFSCDKDVCYFKMQVYQAVNTARDYGSQQKSTDLYKDTNTSMNQTSSKITQNNNHTSTSSNITLPSNSVDMHDANCDIDSIQHPIATQTQTQTQTSKLALDSTRSHASSNSVANSTNSYASRSHTSSSVTSSSTASSSNRSRARSKSSGRKKGSLSDTFVPHPRTLTASDIAYFNLNFIEQHCGWPMECQVSTENYNAFNDMITQKVEQACKFLFTVVPDQKLNEHERSRFEFEGGPFGACISWSPYQTYCGIAECTCEQDFGIPHFLYDAAAIPRTIPYNVLIDKDSKNEENKKIKENLYTKMKKENGLGKKIWQNSRNRVSRQCIQLHYNNYNSSSIYLSL
jgi:hypothetical protein